MGSRCVWVQRASVRRNDGGAREESDVARGRADVALTNGFLDSNRSRVLNGASNRVQRATYGALEMTNPAVSVANILTVLFDGGARTARGPQAAVRTPDRRSARGQHKIGSTRPPSQATSRSGAACRAPKASAGHVSVHCSRLPKTRATARPKVLNVVGPTPTAVKLAPIADHLRSWATVQLCRPFGVAVVQVMRSPFTRAVYDLPPAEKLS